MSTRHLFRSDITTSESAVGFVQAEVLNPNAHYGGAPEKLQVVIYRVGKSHRIIKMRDPDSQIIYKMQVYGTFSCLPADIPPEWCPWGVLNDTDPHVAVQKIPLYLKMEEGPPGLKSMPAPDSELGL